MRLAPVFYTLAQVKFNPISQMAQYVSKIQEQLRHKGFPDFSQDIQIALSVKSTPGSPAELSQKELTRWNFNNIAENEGFVLLEDSLAFHTTSYSCFDDFLEKLQLGLSLLHEAVDLSYIDRIGLRYLDLIVPSNGQNIDNYLKKELLGLTQVLSGEFKNNFSETAFSIEKGTLVVKSFLTNEAAMLPPDLAPLKLRLDDRFLNQSLGVRAILDMDYFTEKRFEFNLDNVLERLRISHDIVSSAFRSSITEFAIESWG